MTPFLKLTAAREFMGLPPLISVKDLKKRYKELSKVMHPDKGGDVENMQTLIESYALILEYMENYRFRLDEEEITAQFPYEDYKKRFRF